MSSFKKPVQQNTLVKVTAGDEDRRCAYVSQQFGRCRYWGTISKPSGAPAICNGHYRSESGIDAEQVVEARLKWRPTYMNIKTGDLEYGNGEKAEQESAEVIEERWLTIWAPRFNIPVTFKGKARFDAMVKSTKWRGKC